MITFKIQPFKHEELFFLVKYKMAIFWRQIGEGSADSKSALIVNQWNNTSCWMPTLKINVKTYLCLISVNKWKEVWAQEPNLENTYLFNLQWFWLNVSIWREISKCYLGGGSGILAQFGSVYSCFPSVAFTCTETFKK